MTSDVPAQTLSAPPPEQQSPPSQNFQHAAFTDSPNSSSQPKDASNLKSSQKQATVPKTFESLTNGQSIPSMSSGNHTATAPTGRSASHSQLVTRERPHTMPLTQGHNATLPPPVDRVVNQSEHVRQQSVVEVPKVLQRPRPYHRLVRRLDTRPDYGWLINDLREKLEHLKFYPHIARLNKWEGTVVIQMKILEDGYLIEPAVEESSGVEVLDQTALAIIRQASPLKLAHPLLAKTVMLSVPLTFHLE